MKVIITGASGFVGSHIVRALWSQGCEIHLICREQSNCWRIEDLLPSLHLIRGELDSDIVKEYLTRIKPELCIHAAWYATPGKYATALENVDSLQRSLNLILHLVEVGCRRFVGIGTCFEYDFNSGYLSESSPTHPISLYAATKIAFSQVIQELGKSAGMEVVWTRLFYQYGPMEDEKRLIAGIITSLLKDRAIEITKGEQVRDFLHVEDIASAIWSVACSKLKGVVNIGSGQPVTVREIATRLGEYLHKPHLVKVGALPYRPNDPMFICANNQRLKDHTNWLQKYDLETGLQQTIDWYKNSLE
jgi:nucleoside-diphosphate-sugar epimerase